MLSCHKTDAITNLANGRGGYHAFISYSRCIYVRAVAVSEDGMCACPNRLNSDLLMPLQRHAVDTLMHLGNLAPNSQLSASPMCYEHVGSNSCDGPGEVRGWMLDTPGVASASALPVGHSLFDGVSIARCEMTEQDVLRVMRDATG